MPHEAHLPGGGRPATIGLMTESDRRAFVPPSDPRLDGVLTELRACEPIFHRPELGTTRAAFEAMTAPDYWETGASGRRYSREVVWAALELRYADPSYWDGDAWSADGFACREIAPDTYLLTYTLDQAGRITRRLTVWQRAGSGWRVLYHQGTIVEDAAEDA